MQLNSLWSWFKFSQLCNLTRYFHDLYLKVQKFKKNLVKTKGLESSNEMQLQNNFSSILNIWWSKRNHTDLFLKISLGKQPISGIAMTFSINIYSNKQTNKNTHSIFMICQIFLIIWQIWLFFGDLWPGQCHQDFDYLWPSLKVDFFQTSDYILRTSQKRQTNLSCLKMEFHW